MILTASEYRRKILQIADLLNFPVTVDIQHIDDKPEEEEDESE